ncbi:MAG: hypothetical protein R3C32_14445 [Chloroflexota bacterium]
MHGRGGPIAAGLSAAIAQDPFGEDDPVEVARLVRRALAADGHKAVAVSGLVVITDAEPGVDALRRLARRALGPHGGSVPPELVRVPVGASHDERLAVARSRRPADTSVVVVIVLGPRAMATAWCLSGVGSRRPSGRPSGPPTGPEARADDASACS